MASAQFKIIIPSATAPQSTKRLPKYVSTSTQSVIITLATVNSTAYSGTASAPASIATNLTPSSSNCSNTGGNLVCTANATAVVGSDTYTVTMYDAQQASTSPTTPAGTVLSQGTTTLTIASGGANTGTLTLNPVVSSIVVAFAANAHVSGTQGAGFSIVGNQPRTFTVSALDPDGNTIVGPGAPTFTVTSGNAAVAVNTTATAGTFTAQVQSFSSTPAQLTVTPSAGSTVHVNVTTKQELWVGDSAGGSVLGFDPTTGTQISGDTIPASVTGPAVFILGTAPNGDLLISNFTGGPGPQVAEVVPETTTAVFSVVGSNTGFNGTFGSAIDASGDLFVADGSSNAISKFSAAGITGATGALNLTPSATTTTNASDPVQIAFDGSQNLWVANNASSAVSQYTTSLSAGVVLSGPSTNLNGPTGVAFDQSGNLWVVNNVTSTVTAYVPANITLGGGDIAPFSTIAGGSTGMNGPVCDAFDAAGNLWVANRGVSTVTEYAAGSLAAGGNLSPTRTLNLVSGSASGVTFTP